MTASEMRAILLQQYGGSWQMRVRAMSDQQVTAIYLRMQRAGKLHIPRSVPTRK